MPMLSTTRESSSAGADVTGTSGLHAFIVQNGKMTDLNSLIPTGSGFVLFRGLAINNSGQIVVEAYPSGTPVRFLRQPREARSTC